MGACLSTHAWVRFLLHTCGSTINVSQGRNQCLCAHACVWVHIHNSKFSGAGVHPSPPPLPSPATLLVYHIWIHRLWGIIYIKTRVFQIASLVLVRCFCLVKQAVPSCWCWGTFPDRRSCTCTSSRTLLENRVVRNQKWQCKLILKSKCVISKWAHESNESE